MFGESLDRLEDAGLQPRFVGATVEGRDQVDVAFRLAAAFLEPGHGKGGAFADGETVGTFNMFFADENGRNRCADHHFVEVVGHAVLVTPDLLFLAFDVEFDRDVGHEHGFRA